MNKHCFQGSETLSVSRRSEVLSIDLIYLFPSRNLSSTSLIQQTVATRQNVEITGMQPKTHIFLDILVDMTTKLVHVWRTVSLGTVYSNQR